ncbi:MAG: UvrD-helicase domain-containing protein [Bacteroides sp.]|nr:UvrD-helicase domain-containing protein [Bacteroides sp.]
MMFNQTEAQEKTYLQEIISTIRKTIEGADSSVRIQEQILREQKDYLWQSRTDIDAQEVKSQRESILNTLAIGEGVIAKRKRLVKLLDIPYFGRIDFCEKEAGSITTPVYIGIHTFYDSEKKANLIYDWRAPVSGMFYDYELGEAAYLSPTGEVKGDILLKRQYRIRKGVMEYMIESSLNIHDDILQKELSANADNKMKNIVATIQREQNRIIRNEEAPVLIIQGVAGSGKTSIALHRVAYLLYAHKDTLSSSDILIISPNKVFANYISNVLPELGEETVPETSMEELLSGILENKYKFLTFFDQVSELLNKPSPDFIQRIQYKSTFDFIAKLDRFILHLENHYFRPVDVKISKYITIPGEYIEEQYKRFHRYPIRERFEVMADYITDSMKIQYGINLVTTQKNLLKKEIRQMFAFRNDMEIYKEFFQWAGTPDMFKLRKNRMLEYADLAPLAYLRISLDGVKTISQVKHLLIDEMQDYSPIQYKVLLKLFTCRKTVLGDASQSVNPYGSSTADMIQKALVKGEIMKLCKSYRSTYEITAFAQKIRKNEELEVVERHGEEPQILSYKSPKEELTGISRLIADFRNSDYKSLGIICKDETQATELFQALRTVDSDIFILSSQSSTFTNGVVITSAHMAKGLEFDEVIIPYADSRNYQNEIDRSMLYVAATRAMHRLSLTYSGEKNHFIIL